MADEPNGIDREEPLFDGISSAAQSEANNEAQAKTRFDQNYRHFKKFHNENPEFWNHFQRFAYRAIRRGFNHYSARTVFHAIRWYVSMKTRSTDMLKINNTHSPFYSRMFRKTWPEYQNLFRYRKLISKEKPAYATDIPFYYTGAPEDEEMLDRELEELGTQGNTFRPDGGSNG